MPAFDLVAALDATVRHARGSALYRERLAGVEIRSPGDLARLPLTTRADLQAAGPHGTRAVPLTAVCHYGESSGTTGATNSVWLTAGDFARDAETLRARHPEMFAPGQILLNRFPFMAAPAHLVQLVAQQGGGVAIPAGNINWDVPFPRALALARTTGATVLAGLPIEPIVLGEIARAQGLDVRRDTKLRTLFLGGSPLPPAMQRRLARVWDARVIELYGSTETMLLGTSCAEGTLHLEPELAYCEILAEASTERAASGAVGRLVVTTLAVEGSPLVRLDTGDLVRSLGACACGDARPAIVVLGRAADAVELGGRRLFPAELVDAAAAAADAVDSSVFFVVVLSDRVLVRIERQASGGDPAAAFAARLPGVPHEIELVEPQMLLDVELLARSPHVYKPVVLADWRRAGRRVLTVSEGMIEWPRPSWAEGKRWLRRTWRTAMRRRRLAREIGVAAPARRLV
ncbi:MAG TPA: AMP-binding protein [Candidatus Limnocylindria bacterium]|nr:AMP-binding protein [Candidatus Limnocylindria bacterium]